MNGYHVDWLEYLERKRLRYLQMAIDQFGPAADHGYRFAGFTFVDDVPHIWYPGGFGAPIYQIALSANCTWDNITVTCELPHEVVHSLAVPGRAEANLLEEGVATWFELRISAAEVARPRPPHQKYAGPVVLVEELLRVDPNAIRSLREQNPYMSRLTETEFAAALPTAPPELVRRLLIKFNGGNYVLDWD